jgi:hypothetical protein
VYEDNVNRGKWTMGEVEELVVGRDGVVRGVVCCHLLYISFCINNNANIALLVTKNGFSVIFTA